MAEVTAPETVSTVKTWLRPIDRDGLMAFAEKGRNNPASRGTNKVRTVVDGQYRTLSYVGQHAPVVVDEPLHLFGQDTAPAPGEVVLSALGGCLAVGITAVATWKQVKLSKLELFLEGDIGNPAAWGAGGASKLPADMGFQAIRVKVEIEGDAPREVLDEIVQHANLYSPVANSMRNPIAFANDTEFLIDVLDARAHASELSLRAAQSALLHQGARGYLMSSAVQRRVRESHFVAIVTPAIKHLRKEIARLSAAEMPA